eukprot:6479201-Amphidinium_carterae.1
MPDLTGLRTGAPGALTKVVLFVRYSAPKAAMAASSAGKTFTSMGDQTVVPDFLSESSFSIVKKLTNLASCTMHSTLNAVVEHITAVPTGCNGLSVPQRPLVIAWLSVLKEILANR